MAAKKVSIPESVRKAKGGDLSPEDTAKLLSVGLVMDLLGQRNNEKSSKTNRGGSAHIKEKILCNTVDEVKKCSPVCDQNGKTEVLTANMNFLYDSLSGALYLFGMETKIYENREGSLKGTDANFSNAQKKAILENKKMATLYMLDALGKVINAGIRHGEIRNYATLAPLKLVGIGFIESNGKFVDVKTVGDTYFDGDTCTFESFFDGSRERSIGFFGMSSPEALLEAKKNYEKMIEKVRVDGSLEKIDKLFDSRNIPGKNVHGPENTIYGVKTESLKNCVMLSSFQGLVCGDFDLTVAVRSDVNGEKIVSITICEGKSSNENNIGTAQSILYSLLAAAAHYSDYERMEDLLGHRLKANTGNVIPCPNTGMCDVPLKKKRKVNVKCDKNSSVECDGNSSLYKTIFIKSNFIKLFTTQEYSFEFSAPEMSKVNDASVPVRISNCLNNARKLFHREGDKTPWISNIRETNRIGLNQCSEYIKKSTSAVSIFDLDALVRIKRDYHAFEIANGMDYLREVERYEDGLRKLSLLGKPDAKVLELYKIDSEPKVDSLREANLHSFLSILSRETKKRFDDMLARDFTGREAEIFNDAHSAKKILSKTEQILCACEYLMLECVEDGKNLVKEISSFRDKIAIHKSARV